MSTVLYYFSATGNTLAITKIVQKKLKAKVVPIASLINKKEIIIQEDVVGILFPIYYVNMPNIIKDFLKKLKYLENKYIFLICTYGGGKGLALQTANSILGKNGGKISAFYGIHMTQSAFKKPFEDPTRLTKKAKQLLDNIDKIINNKKINYKVSNWIVDIFQIPLTYFLNSFFEKYLLKMAQINSDFSVEKAIYNLDKYYYSDENCNGCATCEKVCLVNNIKIVSNKPSWQHHCENCLACINWCPQKAIHDKKENKKTYYYRHPDIKITEIISEKNDRETNEAN